MKKYFEIMAPHDDEGGYEEDMKITLEFEDEGEVECVVLGIFEVDAYPDDMFMAVAPLDESDDVYIYIYEELSDDDDEVEFTLHDIEDDDQFQTVVEAFDAIMEEE